MKRRFQFWADRSAVGLSGFCLAHCLLGLMALIVLSSPATGVLDHDIHQVGLAVAIALAVLGLGRGIALHGRWLVAVLGAVGIAFMSGALAASHGAPEALFTAPGVLLVGAAHLLNMRWSHAA